MPIYLRQSTASQEVPLGYFVDSTDGDTAETGLTIANSDIKIWKTGATTLANKNSGGGTHISGGIYYAVLDATDTDTIGPLVIFVHMTGALSVRLECCVLDEAVYDVLFGTAALSTYAGGAVASVTGAVGSVTTGVTVTTNNDKTGYALSATGSAALTEGYAADGAAPTLNQMLYQIWAFLAEKSISGTTMTVKKLDGSTTAMTFTLDSASAPTSITRAT